MTWNTDDQRRVRNLATIEAGIVAVMLALGAATGDLGEDWGWWLAMSGIFMGFVLIAAGLATIVRRLGTRR